MDSKKSEEFYKKLKGQLADTSSWPSDYLYKFIVPTDELKIKQIQDIFDNTGAVIESNRSCHRIEAVKKRDLHQRFGDRKFKKPRCGN